MPKETNSSRTAGLWNDVFRFHFQENASTSSAAMKWLRKSQPGQVAIFTTDHQIDGRGQHGRIWQHRKSKDLAWSMAIHFDEPRRSENIASEFWMQLNMALTEGLKRCVANVLAPSSAAELRIKWPNDLFVFHDNSWKKCSGVLVENHWKGSKFNGFVVGIGINVARLASQQNWTALQNFSKEKLTVDHVQFLLEHELQKLLPLNDLIFEPLTIHRLDRYQRNLYGWNEVLSFRYQKSTHRAKFLGINAVGQAQVQWLDGPNTGLITSHTSSGELEWV